MSTQSQEQPTGLEELYRRFADPPADCRPMVRWWWFGCAVTTEEIERELIEMHRQGIGGVELQPVYPHNIDDPARGIRNVAYLSDEWLELMRFAVEKARELGMVFDATFGSGWPFGGPYVPPELAAKRLRCVQVDVRDTDEVLITPPVRLQESERVLTVFACPITSGEGLDLGARVRLEPDQQTWRAPRGRWRVMWFLSGHTLQQVKRPAVGAEGLVIDHFDRAAFDLHASIVGTAYKALAAQAGEGSVRAMFCDSWEVFGSNWTARLLDCFRERRGYDLIDYLPALWNDIGPETSFVRWDYRRTLSELALEEFFQPLADWCERSGFQARVQAHGTPAELLRAYGTAHIPEGESYGAQLRFQPSPDEGIPAPAGLYHRTFSASAGALFNRRLCSSESYTWLRNPRFMVSLEDIKAASDIQFTQGVNNIVCHGYPYSPPQAGVPGWAFYASSVINHNNTWWPYFRHAADYIGRVCLMLRQGQVASSLCVYVPTNDAWAESEQPPRSSGAETVRRLPEDLFRSLRLSGYQYDFIDDDSLGSRARIDGGRLRVGVGDYRALLIPNVERMQPAAAARTAEFAASGGIVLFVDRLPGSSCSLARREEETAEVRRLIRQAVADGAVLTEQQSAVRELLRRLPPDLILEPADPDVGFRHRRDGSTHIYFLTNVSTDEKRMIVRAPVKGRAVHVWDPVAGSVWNVPDCGENGVKLDLRLEPFQSLVITISDDPLQGLPVWPNGQRREAFDIPLDKGWTMRVPEDAEPIKLETLNFWTDRPNLLHYSGRGAYSIELTLPSSLGPGQEAWLELGEVREVAEVHVNGKTAGVTWKRPHRLEIGSLLKEGVNHLNVVVTNLLINRVLGEPDEDFTELIEGYGQRFPPPREKQKAEPAPSGLLGPVRIVVMETRKP